MMNWMRKSGPGLLDASDAAQLSLVSAPEKLVAATVSAPKLLSDKVRFAAIGVAIFAAIAVLLSRMAGVPFGKPVDGTIPAFGVDFSVPPLAAAVGYLLLQVGCALFGRTRHPVRRLLQRMLDDYLLLVLFVVVIYIHFNIKMWVPLLNPHRYDVEYFAIDQAVRPVLDILGWIRAKVALGLPAVDLWYQVGFFSIIVVSFMGHSVGNRRWHYHNMIALLLIEMIGPLTYLIAPAVGPFIFEQGPNRLATAAELSMYDVYKQVLSGGAAWIAQHGSVAFAEPLSAMPSLHLGAATVVTYYAVRARHPILPFVLLATLWIGIESVVARWHYLVDLPVALVLAILIIWITNRLCGAKLSERRDDMGDRKSTRLNSSHIQKSRMPSSA